MKVSIIIPYYNSSIYFNRLESSIKAYINDLDYEIIIINDCSESEETERLLLFINNMNAANLIYINNTVNVGASVSRKRGVEAANCKYIAFLDSDDAWYFNKLEYQYETMEKFNIDILGGITNVVDEKKFFNKSLENIDFENLQITQLSFVRFLFKNYYSTPSVMIKRKVIIDENFSENLRYSEDFECWRRISLKYTSYFMSNSLTYSFKHSYISNIGSLSSNLNKMNIGELKGFFMLFKYNLKLYYYPLVILAIFFSCFKALIRYLKFYIRSQ